MAAAPRPYLASLLTTVGGAFIAAGGLVLWAIGTVLAHVFGLASPLYLGGLLLGLLTMAVGGSMLLVPRARKVLGIVALGCAIASIPLAFGGFVVGFVLTAIGGAAAAARPRGPTVVVTTASPSGPAPPWT